MNCVFTPRNLHKGLAAVSASIPTKTTLPILSNILFEAEQDGVWMSGTDLDVAVRVWVPAVVKEQGSLTAPGKKLGLPLSSVPPMSFPLWREAIARSSSMASTSKTGLREMPVTSS